VEEAEKEISTSLQQWQATFDAISDAVSLLDPEGRILQCNKSMPQLLGKPLDEIIGRTCWEVIHGTSGPIEGCPFLRMKKTRRRETTALKSGDQWFEVTVDPLLDESGNVLGAVHIIADITEWKRVEETLSLELQINTAISVLSRSLISSATIEEISSLVLEYAKQLTNSPFGYVGYIDSATGYLVTPTLTREIWDICRVEDKSIVFKEFTGLWGWVLKNQESFFTNNPEEDPRSSGTPPGHIPIRRFLSAPALINGELIGQISAANADRDYTERDRKVVNRLADLYAVTIHRKRIEDALCQSERKYHTLFDDSPISLWEEDFSKVKSYIDSLKDKGVKDFRNHFKNHPEDVISCATLVKIVDVNQSTLKMYGAKSKEDFLVGLDKIFGKESYDVFREELITLIEGKTFFASYAVNRTLTGERRDIQLTWVIAPGHEENWSKLLVSIVDITDRKQAEENPQ
jgi:PAS domain S-box-containing protein